MGYSWTVGATRKDVIKEITESHNNKWYKINQNNRIGRTQTQITYNIVKCIRQCSRGYTTLWTVWENNTYNIITDELIGTRKYILCSLLKRVKETGHARLYSWGHKDMPESVCPYYFSCPMGYLKLAELTSKKWREGVKAYHIKYKVGDELKLSSRDVPYAIITSTKPLIGRRNGRLYRIRRETIIKLVIQNMLRTKIRIPQPCH